MTAGRLESRFLNDERGAITTSYGPYILKSAFQPIFSQNYDGQLVVEACEALIRPFQGNNQVSPGEFFKAVEPKDALAIDTLCRELHILNMGKMARKSARLFVNFNPRLFTRDTDISNEVSRMIDACVSAGLRPGRVVCEITEQGGNETVLMNLVQKLRASRFKIAIDDYGVDDSDIERVDRIQPEVIKFDAAWVRRFSETPAGIGLLRLMVEKFVKRGIDCLFEGLEEEHQLHLCEEIGVKLMQGYALARPEIAPTDFNIRFPEFEPATAAAAVSQPQSIHSQATPVQPVGRAPDLARSGPVANLVTRRTATFGRRQR